MSKRSFKDFCLDYESDYDKKPNAFDVWEELESQLTAMREKAEKAEAMLKAHKPSVKNGQGMSPNA